MVIILVIGAFFTGSKVVPTKGTPANSRVFRLLAIEQMFDSYYMKSAQFFIKKLLQYPNWNNSTDDYVSYIRLFSMWEYEDIDDEVKPFWVDRLYRVYLKEEIINFLGNASPGEIVVLYYCGHSHVIGHPLHSEFLGISEEELRDWLGDTLLRAHLTLVLDTCYSGYWIDFSNRSSILAASGQRQFAWGGDVGIFTLGLAEAFTAENDSNNDGWLALGEVFPHARNYTEATVDWTSQNPESFYSISEGDLPLVQINEAKEFPLWDISITNITMTNDPMSRIIPGTPISIKASIENKGTKPMTFTASLYVNHSRIQTYQVTLFPHGVESLTCTWNTAGLYGLCTMNFTLILDFCPGELTIDDNINHLYHKVIIAMRTDLNYDSIIDISDIIVAAEAFGSYPGHPRWNPVYDIDNDRRIRVIDLAWIASDFGLIINI
ncbi:MAG: hypothetical protein JSV05_08760 [Candidatus Bathyarchaeota archaeon]|nr:MAG: hypothetical protein JSV05_08760 [Candidatus Bathyarchaeota archaeon]